MNSLDRQQCSQHNFNKVIRGGKKSSLLELYCIYQTRLESAEGIANFFGVFGKVSFVREKHPKSLIFKGECRNTVTLELSSATGIPYVNMLNNFFFPVEIYTESLYFD